MTMFYQIKKMAPYILVAIFFVVIDRFLKSLAILKQEKVNLIGDLFSFNFSENYNIAFSLPVGGLILVGLIILIILILIYFLINLVKKNQHYLAGLLFVLIIGAASNLLDRFKYGYVVDYLDLKYFTVFNIADVMIVCSVGVLIYINFMKDKRGREDNRHKEDESKIG